MLGLIKKDLLLTKGNIKSIFVIVAVFILMSVSGEMELSVMLPVICVMLFCSTFSYDEFNDWNSYVITIPKGRKSAVRSKYLSTTILALITTLITCLVSVISGVINNNLVLNNILSSLAASILAVAIIVSLMYPLIYKYGVEKGRIGLFIMVFLVTILGGLLIKSVDNNLINNINNFLNSYGLILIPVISCILLYVSYLISNRIYSNKEF